MNRLTWWFRIVGILYLIFGIGFIPAINSARLEYIFPNFDAPIDGVAYNGILDFSFMFGLDLMVIGGFLLFYAARKPLENLNIVWLIVWLELIRGILDDIYMIIKGYDPVFYIGFIIVHIIIISTGILFVKKIKMQKV